MVRDLEAEKEQARVQVEAAAQGRRQELLAEQGRLESVIAQIKVNQQELLDDLRDKRRQGESDMAGFQASIERLRAEFNALDEEANLQSFGTGRGRGRRPSARGGRRVGALRGAELFVEFLDGATCSETTRS